MAVTIAGCGINPAVVKSNPPHFYSPMNGGLWPIRRLCFGASDVAVSKQQPVAFIFARAASAGPAKCSQREKSNYQASFLLELICVILVMFYPRYYF